MIIAKEHAEFLTVTCFEWTHVLKEDRFKDIECESLLVKEHQPGREKLEVRIRKPHKHEEYIYPPFPVLHYFCDGTKNFNRLF